MTFLRILLILLCCPGLLVGLCIGLVAWPVYAGILATRRGILNAQKKLDVTFDGFRKSLEDKLVMFDAVIEGERMVKEEKEKGGAA